MNDRYRKMFAANKGNGKLALIPFLVIGDPDRCRFLEHVEQLIRAGADAIELGMPFSDPVADGPVITAAAARSLAAGCNQPSAFEMLSTIRSRHPELPIGLMAYANLVLANGASRFYEELSRIGIDSLLVPDLPLREAAPYLALAAQYSVAQVLILPPGVNEARLKEIASASRGYVYVLGRNGVTGAKRRADRSHATAIAALQRAKAAPAVIGFGISGIEQVENARRSGARGVIVGSALVDELHGGGDATALLRRLKHACIGFDSEYENT